MKKTLVTLAVLAAIPLAVPSALAGFGHGRGGPGGPNPEFMARALDLTPEQQEKMKALFAEQAKKRDEMRAAMQTDMRSRMQAILTPEQLSKMDDLRQTRMGGGPGMAQGMAGGGCQGMQQRRGR